jgi:hypothetical protein
MKRVCQWVIGIGILASIGFLATEAGSAQEIATCSLATLKGQYMDAVSGTVFPPAFGVQQPAVSASAGYSIYNGDGTGEDHVTLTINGVNANVPSPTATSYTLNPDCTGTKTVLPSGPTFNIYVAIDGSSWTNVSTLDGFAVAGFHPRAGRPR